MKPLAALVPASPLFLARHFWAMPFRALFQLFDRRRATAQCGHTTRRRGILRVDDEHLLFHCPDPRPMLCLDCIVKHTIPCAWCGGAILPGDPVTLYTPMDANYVPKHPDAKRYRDDPVTYVGCLRFGCAESGADRAGYWYPPQGVHRVPTAIETLLANPGMGMIVNDLSDPRSKPVLFPIDLPHHVTDAHN